MYKLWLELKYGTRDAELTLVRSKDFQTISYLARRALRKAEGRVAESKVLDPVLSILDQSELAKLTQLFDLLVGKDISRENGQRRNNGESYG